jgi:NADH dehydrogenase [ubiquinone] 1 alpha subcomplex assembly factor 7
MDAAVPEERRAADEGTVIETCPGAAAAVSEVAGRLARQGGVALFVDYGHVAPRTGSTLQAVRAHRKVDPFEAPGEADLTTHVDFAALAEIAQVRGARWLGTVPQGAWLRALGIEARAQALAAAAPERREALAHDVERLTGDAQMGQLFKVMGLAAPEWPEAAGFA